MVRAMALKILLRKLIVIVFTRFDSLVICLTHLKKYVNRGAKITIFLKKAKKIDLELPLMRRCQPFPLCEVLAGRSAFQHLKVACKGAKKLLGRGKMRAKRKKMT